MKIEKGIPVSATTGRNEKILSAAVKLAETKGYKQFTREEVATQAGVATGTINTAFQTMDRLRDAVMERAVTTRNGAILAQGLGDKHPYVMGSIRAVETAMRHVLGR